MVGFHACPGEGYGFVVFLDIARLCAGNEPVINVINERKGERLGLAKILG